MDRYNDDYPYSNNNPRVNNLEGSELPQVNHRVSSESPQVNNRGYSDLEAVKHANRVNTPGEQVNEKDYRDDRRKICGLRLVTFCLSLALLLAIILIAVAAGVGGGLAGSDSNSRDSGHTPANGQISTKTVSVTGTAPPTSSSSTPTLGIARNYCNNGTIYTSITGAKFKRYCSVDWSSNSVINDGGVRDLAIKIMGSYEACMDACAQSNKAGPSEPQCKAISFFADLTFAVQTYGGNCWFKSAAGTANTIFPGTQFPELSSCAALQ